MSPAAEKRGYRLALALLFLTLLIVGGRVLPVAEWLARFQEEVRAMGPSGPLLYVAMYAICCIVFIPASALSLAAGAIFGLPLGIVVVLSGATAGAAGAFLLGRTIFRQRAKAMIDGNPRFKALDRAIAREGGRIVFLVRLSPLFPFTWVNYAFGVTGVRTGSYILATVTGILPGTIAFVYLGSAAATAAGGEAPPLRVALQILGALATLAVSVLVARAARKAIAQAGAGEQSVSDGAAEGRNVREQPPLP